MSPGMSLGMSLGQSLGMSPGMSLGMRPYSVVLAYCKQSIVGSLIYMYPLHLC